MEIVLHAQWDKHEMEQSDIAHDSDGIIHQRCIAKFNGYGNANECKP